MQTINLEEAQRRLAEIVEKLPPGGEIIITRGDSPVARLVGMVIRPRPGPGLGKGMITIVADDDEHLQDFAEYMP